MNKDKNNIIQSIYYIEMILVLMKKRINLCFFIGTFYFIFRLVCFKVLYLCWKFHGIK